MRSSITHLHLDHCGDLVPVALGARARAGDRHARAGAARAAGRARHASRRSRRSADSSQVFDVRRVRGRRRRSRRRAITVTPRAVAHYDEPTFGLPRRARTAACSPTPATRPDARARRARARRRRLSLRGDAARSPEGDPHGHMTRGRGAFRCVRASGARRLLLTHRAAELPLDESRLRRVRARAVTEQLARSVFAARRCLISAADPPRGQRRRRAGRRTHDRQRAATSPRLLRSIGGAQRRRGDALDLAGAADALRHPRRDEPVVAVAAV